MTEPQMHSFSIFTDLLSWVLSVRSCNVIGIPCRQWSQVNLGLQLATSQEISVNLTGENNFPGTWQTWIYAKSIPCNTFLLISPSFLVEEMMSSALGKHLQNGVQKLISQFFHHIRPENEWINKGYKSD